MRAASIQFRPAKGPRTDNETGLHLAASSGNVKMVRGFISAGIDLEVKTHATGFTALHVAVIASELDIFGEGNSEKSLTTAQIQSQATLAQRSVVEALLQAGADIDARDKFGGTPLHWAVEKPWLVSALLEKGANINAVDKYGCTALHYACRDENLPAVRKLLRADINGRHAKDKYGSTPLHKTFKNRTLAIVKVLISKAEVGTGTGPPQQELAARRRAFLNARDNYDQTLLHLAAEKGRVGLVKYLCDQGACAKVRDAKGETPLQKAISIGNHLAVDLLYRAIHFTKCLFCGSETDLKFDPCGHTGVCFTCSHSWQECCWCKAPILEWSYGRPFDIRQMFDRCLQICCQQ